MTIEIILGADRSVAEYVRGMIPNQCDFGDNIKAMGFVIDGRPVGGVVWHDYNKAWRSIEISMAATSPIWSRRSVWMALYQFAFEEMGVNRVQAKTVKKNFGCRKLLKGAGFKEEGCLRQAVLSDDLMVYGLIPPDVPEWAAKHLKLPKKKGRI